MDQIESQGSNKGFFGGFIPTLLLIWDFAKIVIIALIIILPIRYFVFQPFIVSGSSMETNFKNGQYLIIDELSYYFTDPQRGQVVVLRPPNNLKDYYIKRIIALPGEKIQLENSTGRIIIYNNEHPDGMSLEEPYLSNQGLTYPENPSVLGGKKILTLGDDEYFLLGDNRLHSSDSRDWGPLPRNEIVGKVFMRLLPLNSFDVYTKAPAYNF